MEPYNRYLSGEADIFPQNPDIATMNRLIDTDIKEYGSSVTGKQKKRLRTGFSDKPVSKYLDTVPHPDEEDVRDLFSLAAAQSVIENGKNVFKNIYPREVF